MTRRKTIVILIAGLGIAIAAAIGIYVGLYLKPVVQDLNSHFATKDLSDAYKVLVEEIKAEINDTAEIEITHVDSLPHLLSITIRILPDHTDSYTADGPYPLKIRDIVDDKKEWMLEISNGLDLNSSITAIDIDFELDGKRVYYYKYHFSDEEWTFWEFE